MNDNVIARRYAKGLAQVAAEQNELAQVREDLAALADLMDPERGDISVPELLDCMLTPTIPVAQKIQVTDVLCEKLKIGKTVSDFLNVLIENGRVGICGRIATEFEKIASQFESTAIAVVETARPLTDEQQKALRTLLQEKTGQTVHLRVRKKPELLGGVRVKIGDLVLDGSIQNRLQRLETRLK